jgi:hypothetical protein
VTPNEPPKFKRNQWNEPVQTSHFQWLPADVVVEWTEKATFVSEINNLDSTRFLGIYECFTEIIEKMLPGYSIVWDYASRLPFRCLDLNDVSTIMHVNFKNTVLQMIIKITEYQLAPGEEYLDPRWHSEGLYPEQIIMTGLCCLQRDRELEGGDFEFQRIIDEREGRYFLDQLIALQSPTGEEGGMTKWVLKIFDQWTKPLGKTSKLQTGELILFPNCHSYRQEKLWNPLPKTSESSLLTQRFVHFYLVHPHRPVVSAMSQLPMVKNRNHMTLETALELRAQLRKERMEYCQDAA